MNLWTPQIFLGAKHRKVVRAHQKLNLLKVFTRLIKKTVLCCKCHIREKYDSAIKYNNIFIRAIRRGQRFQWLAPGINYPKSYSAPKIFLPLHMNKNDNVGALEWIVIDSNKSSFISVLRVWLTTMNRSGTKTIIDPVSRINFSSEWIIEI